MENTKIINRLRKVKTLKGFAKLLNDIKRDEFGTAKYKITDKQLRHFSSPDIFANRYKAFHIRKKSGGVREINAPCYQLKVILYILNKVFKAVYTPSKAAMGFTEERSVVTNASLHTGHHYVFNIDLENFFPSIPQARVWKRLQLPPFNFPIEIANVVAGLCCHKNEDGTKNVLPQGAATSPILTNAICDNLDRRMLGVARRFGLHYSRYADDMTFSSMHNVYQEGSDFRKEILRIIKEQGFTLNEKKTRLQRTGERQEVTGLTVNETVNVARKYVRDLRCILHVWEKEGYGKAYAYFYPKYKRDKGYIKKGEPVMENVVEGKLNYLRMVKGTGNTTYLKLLERFNKLQTLVYLDKETDKGESYIYVHSYSLKEFEELFQTAVGLVVSKKGNLIGQCEIAGKEKVVAVSKSTQKKLCKNLADIAPDTVVTSEALKKCYVTLCRAKGKNHWLITKSQMQRSKCLSILNVNVDIDHLLLIWERVGLEHAVSAFQSCVGGSSINSISLDDILKNHGISDLESIDNDSIKTIWETDGDNMEQKDLQEFIYFLTRSKQLTRVQQKKRDYLLARDYEPINHEINSVIDETNSSNEIISQTPPKRSEINHRHGVKAKYTPPHNIQQFLQDYNQDSVLKYTCHLIDADEVVTDINNECYSNTYDFFKHIELIKKHFSSLLKLYEERHIFLSPNIISLINVYLTGKDIKGEYKLWSANKIDIGWGCDKLISWAKQNPGKIPNPGPNIVRKQKNSGFSLTSAFLSETTGVRIKSFSQLVIFFKSQFHIRSDNSLKSILSHVNQRWNDTDVIFSFSKERFNNNLELLTDVDKLIQSYIKIINLCIECKSEEGPIRVELSFYDEQDGGHTFFEIHHQNSHYKKTLKNSMERIGEYQARLVEKQINGLCDLYVEALFSDGIGARINLWNSSPDFISTTIDNVIGVKYILSF